ncbi:hypothetical protein F8M41_016627 [Gigaspora margarita]|uniref:Uncharacterized protein n=1 Tax=Gigaspora margarita TaxID=4874 RepID=A0A8H4EMG5_GIGMA|nr:hypothetical protein F8M41_016627 [Gigaspora margarita]
MLHLKRDGSEVNVADAIAVAQAMLNLKYEKIMISDTPIKYKNVKNLTYKRPRVETSEIERDDQDDLSDYSKEAENELENNNSRASSSSFSDDDNDSKKETDDNSKKK